MKMAGRQSTLLFIVIILLIFLAYVVFIQNPESKRLKETQTKLAAVELKMTQIKLKSPKSNRDCFRKSTPKSSHKRFKINSSRMGFLSSPKQTLNRSSKIG